MVDPYEGLRLLHLFVVTAIVVVGSIGMLLAYRWPPQYLNPQLAFLGYTIVVLLVAPVLLGRIFSLSDLNSRPFGIDVTTIVLFVGHLIALGYTLVLLTITVRRIRREQRATV